MQQPSCSSHQNKGTEKSDNEIQKAQEKKKTIR